MPGLALLVLLVQVLLVQVLLVPLGLLGPVLLGLVPELLGPQGPVVRAVLLVQVVPAQGGLRVGVLAACLFTSYWFIFPNVEFVAITALTLRWNMNAAVNTTAQLVGDPLPLLGSHRVF